MGKQEQLYVTSYIVSFFCFDSRVPLLVSFSASLATAHSTPYLSFPLKTLSTCLSLQKAEASCSALTNKRPVVTKAGHSASEDEASITKGAPKREVKLGGFLPL
jgi:hypothetical protein